MKKRNERNELSFSDICFKTRGEGKKEKLRRDKEREKERKRNKKIKLETGNQDIPAYIHDYETAR